jgi:hypothetical protein
MFDSSIHTCYDLDWYLDNETKYVYSQNFLFHKIWDDEAPFIVSPGEM